MLSPLSPVGLFSQQAAYSSQLVPDYFPFPFEGGATSHSFEWLIFSIKVQVYHHAWRDRISHEVDDFILVSFWANFKGLQIFWFANSFLFCDLSVFT